MRPIRPSRHAFAMHDASPPPGTQPAALAADVREPHAQRSQSAAVEATQGQLRLVVPGPSAQQPRGLGEVVAAPGCEHVSAGEGIAISHHVEGRRHQDAGDYAAAERCFAAALALRLAAGNVLGVAYSRFQLAMLSHLRRVDDPQVFASARVALQRALLEEVDAKARGGLMQSLAFCKQHDGAWEDALADYTEVLKVRDLADDARGHAMTRGRMAECLAKLGAPEAQVRAHLQAFVDFFGREGDAARVRQAQWVEDALSARKTDSSTTR